MKTLVLGRIGAHFVRQRHVKLSVAIPRSECCTNSLHLCSAVLLGAVLAKVSWEVDQHQVYLSQSKASSQRFVRSSSYGSNCFPSSPLTSPLNLEDRWMILGTGCSLSVGSTDDATGLKELVWPLALTLRPISLCVSISQEHQFVPCMEC